MNIVVFGASGATGQELVGQGLQRHHNVTAFVRTPAKFKIQHKNLTVFHGDVGNLNQVEEALKNQEAVLSALGASNPVTRNFSLIKGVENIVYAMLNRHVKRIIYQSFLGVGKRRKDLGFLVDRILPIPLRGAIRDHEVKENFIVKSDLLWTIIRCAMLTNKGRTTKYRTGENITSPSLLPTISRADVADFMLNQLNDDQYVSRKPRIMN